MKTKIRKAFIDFEKEENWLNEMAAKGMAMTHYNFCCYTFEDCVPGEYFYRIELLERGANHHESARYICFLEENGIEHIATDSSWIYFRKKAAAGAFELYNDLDSRIKHYSRIARLLFGIGVLEFLLISTQIGGLLSLLGRGSRFWIVSVACMALMLTVSALLLSWWFYYSKKVKRLRREREIFE
jgi:hypothetical protein